MEPRETLRQARVRFCRVPIRFRFQDHPGLLFNVWYHPQQIVKSKTVNRDSKTEKNRIAPRVGTFSTKDISMIQDSPAVIDRSVQCAKLRTDLETATYHAEQVGIPLPDVVVSLLQRPKTSADSVPIADSTSAPCRHSSRRAENDRRRHRLRSGLNHWCYRGDLRRHRHHQSSAAET
jgi:hypothetical protein